MNKRTVSPENKKLSNSVARAMLAASRRARKTAKMYGTPIYVWQNGKVVAKKP